MVEEFEEFKKKTNVNYTVANFMFLILAILFIGLSFLSSVVDLEFKTSIITIQYGVVLMPILVMLKVKNIDIKKAFRLNKISYLTMFKLFLITLTSIPIAYFLNLALNIILMKFDLFIIQEMDLGTGVANFFIIYFLISITPGICEEIFFRGMMLSGYESKMNSKKAIIFTAILFGVFHFNFQNLLLPIFLGLILGTVVKITNSIYSSMIIHSIFNGIGLLVMYPSQSNDLLPSDTSEYINMVLDQAPIILGVLFVVSVISGVLLLTLIKWLKKGYIKIEKDDIIVVKNTEFKIIKLEDEYIVVEDSSFNIKKTTKSKLEQVGFKLIKKDEKVDYGFKSSWNILFVGMVVLAYIILTLLAYI